MIPEKLKDLWPLIYTWLNEGRVQIKIISDWRDVQSISDFKNFNNEFRVSSEPKLVPFTFEDNLLFKDKWFKYKDSAFGRSLKLVAYERDCVTIHNQSFNYQKFLDNYIFEDGSPCGKYINE